MKRRTGSRTFDIVLIAAISVITFVTLVPFLHIIAISFSSNRPILSGYITLYPIGANIDAYKRVFSNTTLIHSLYFSILVTALYTTFSMVMTIAAAYPLTKRKLRGRKTVTVFIIITMFFNGGLIPNYMLLRQLGLINTMWVLVIPLLISPFYLIILRTFFANIPNELLESAQIDGSSEIGTLIRIVLPLSLPALATLSLFYAVNRWNGFQDALYYTSSPQLFTLQMELWEIIQNNMTSAATALEANINQNAIVPQSLKAASIIFATVPILVVYPWLQRYFRSGVMIGAIKG